MIAFSKPTVNPYSFIKFYVPALTSILYTIPFDVATAKNSSPVSELYANDAHVNQV